jgi:Lhr-like helicase
LLEPASPMYHPSVLTGIRTVILDEIHSVVGNKRGVLLITGLDRLVPLSGEFQRIALSATVRPAELVAQYVGGKEGRPAGGLLFRRYDPRQGLFPSAPQRKRGTDRGV